MIAAYLASACASTSAFERRIAALEAENAAFRRMSVVHGSTTTVAHPTSSSIFPPHLLVDRPYVAFVNRKPTFCTGALCLKITNQRPYPVVALQVDGEDVMIQGRRSAIDQHQDAYLRFVHAGEYMITAQLADRIPFPGGHVVGALIETCKLSVVIGHEVQARYGAAMEFSLMHCTSTS